MATTARPPVPPTPFIDAAALSRQWLLGPLAFNCAFITLLDAQTAWWKDFERNSARLMQPWVDNTTVPAPLARPTAYPVFSADAQSLWRAWAQLWMNALQHDATER